MKVATVFEFIISAMDTRVRSMRRMEKKSSVITDPLAVWDFTTANRFQLSFLHDAQERIHHVCGCKFVYVCQCKCADIKLTYLRMH